MLLYTVVTVYLVASTQLAANAVIVETEGGPVRGNVGDYCASFFGIPYAAPPVAENRWRPPQPASPWREVLNTTTDNKPKCLQLPDAGALNIPEGWVEGLEELLLHEGSDFMDEDCLFIDVQTPTVTTESKLPVLVYVHGGTNLAGSGSGKDAASICERQVVFVSMNYRLGVLGVLGLPELRRESGTTGNYGLQDQRAALAWVQRNIARFGGDPSRVTIAGESSGAMAVAAHYALPRSAPLFSQGIIMSGNDDSLTLQEAYAVGSRYAAHMGCQRGLGRLACLRLHPARMLVNSQTSSYNQSMRSLQVPVVDGYELPLGSLLRERYTTPGALTPKRLLAGTNLNDSSLFLGPTLIEVLEFGRVSERELKEAITRFLPHSTEDNRSAVLRMYAPWRYGGSAQQALYDLSTDGYFTCPTRRILRAAREVGAFQYVFMPSLSQPAAAFGLPSWLNPVVEVLAPWLGSFHGANEVLFWNANATASALSPAERALGTRMNDLWSQFVHGRDPWPSSGGGSNPFLALNDGQDRVGESWHAKQCALLEQFRFFWNPPTLTGLPS
ncbi:hypothetical protein CYMTET_19426 [Cymbomonas tetramitiformis]|uniref:Carboxylic ester hydrolase n=1 Tax=Cymbomonas tetramitiformis TaxID=36881 RepID=A0AAE0L572_9CHLO|nr:hypothetical protein CYMTET_19426 [Cymbomonas tetramitiformis]|eukprot:gene10630-12572_t